MATKPAPAPDRASLTGAWMAVDQATRALRCARTLPSIPNLRALVEAGAIVPLAGPAPFELAMRADNAKALAVLLDGSEHLAAPAQWSLVALATQCGAPACLKLMLDRGFPQVQVDTPKPSAPHQKVRGLDHDTRGSALAIAVDLDDFDTTKALLAAGAAKLPALVPSIFSRVQSAAMIQLLAGHGLVPTRKDVNYAVFTPDDDEDDATPRADLLAAFLATGVDSRREPIDCCWPPWLQLLNDLPQRCAADSGCMDRAVDCARLLLEAGHSWDREARANGSYLLGPHALAVLAQAGVPIAEVARCVDRKHVPSALVVDGRWRDPDAGYHAAAAPLRVLARAGLDTDIFWNPSAPDGWKRAMVEAGVDPGRQKDPAISEDLRRRGLQVRLEDRMQAAPAATPRSIPRL